MIFELEVRESGQIVRRELPAAEPTKNIAATLAEGSGVSGQGLHQAKLTIDGILVAKFWYPSSSVEVSFEDPRAPSRPRAVKPSLWGWTLERESERRQLGSMAGQTGNLEGAVSAAITAHRQSPIVP